MYSIKIPVLISIIFCSTFLNKSVLCWSTFNLGDVFNKSLELTAGIIGNFGNALPTTAEIINAPIQLIAGYPSELVVNAIDEFCSFSLKAGSIKPNYEPTNKSVQIQLHTTCEIFFYKLADVDQLFENPHFDRNKKVVIFSAGHNSNPNKSGEVVLEMAKAFNCRGDVNFLVFDSARAINTFYYWSAFNTDQAGFLLANFLSRLVDFVPVENIHLIGFSLGAHIMSYAAKYLNLKTDMEIPQITGLDPARPCFNDGEALSGLSRGDAKFVDVIHTNPGGFGKREAVGDVDFYTNGLDPLVTGCLDIVCSHGRSHKFYVETIYPGNENDFLATRCSSLSKLRHMRCSGKEVAMGYAVDKNVKGNYFLEVQIFPPYGKGGSEEREEANKNCGVCQDM